MGSKYAKLARSLPSLPEDDNPKQQLVNKRKREILIKEPRTGVHFTTKWLITRAKKDLLEAQLAEVEIEVEAYKQLLMDQYEVEGITRLRLDSGDGARLQYEPHLVVEDHDKYRQWCINTGLGRSLALPWPTGNSMLKERLMNGLPEMDGTRAFIKTKVVREQGDDHE
jgi:hypothetical protein